MKKLTAIVLALMLVASLSLCVFAAEKGTITINGAHAENTYSIYKVLDLQYSKDADNKEAYSYTVNAAWEGFFFDDEGNATEAQNYLTVGEGGFVSWNSAMAQTDENKATFAKLAMAYAEANDIAPVQSTENGDETTTATGIQFANLDLGYYLVDSTMGTLCALTTTSLNGVVNAKNHAPTIKKYVLEDYDSEWKDDSNQADIDQTVQFKVTIDAQVGAQNYVLHDDLPAGMTFKAVTKIEHEARNNGGIHEMLATKYTVNTAPTCDHSDVAGLENFNCSFTIAFDQTEVCDKLQANDKIHVYYEAVLDNTDDIVYAGAGNVNYAVLSFGEEGEDHFSNIDDATTYTYTVDIVKTDSSDKLLDGAEFKIYNASTGGNEVFVRWSEEDGCYYRDYDAVSGDTILVKNGLITIKGLDKDTYYLEETLAPEGYNKLTERRSFTITDTNLDATFNDGFYSTGSGVQVVNNTGIKLPETGGMGTFLFTVIGGMLVLATGVVLVTKKRMSKIED